MDWKDKAIEHLDKAERAGIPCRYLFGIPGCHDCPFYEAKYCILGGWLSSRDSIARHNYRVNEWRANVMPDSCPLKEREITSFAPNAKCAGDGREADIPSH